MATRSPLHDRADDSLLTLVQDVPQLVKNLIVAEFNAVKGWLVKTATDAGIGTGLMFVALFFIAWVIPMFLVFLTALLSLWLPVWASALIVMGAPDGDSCASRGRLAARANHGNHGTRTCLSLGRSSAGPLRRPPRRATLRFPRSRAKSPEGARESERFSAEPR